MARAMLFQAGMPKKYWTEAVAYAVYVKNRLPTAGLQMRVPALVFKEISKETAKTLSRHIHVFGCKAWEHTIADGKLSSQAVLCCLLGVDLIKKGYRLLRMSDNKLMVSRNVVFDETSCPMRDKQHSADVPQIR